MWAAGLGPGARQSFSAEWLRRHDGADLIPVHIHVADADARTHLLDSALDARVQTQGQTVARRIDGITNFGQSVARKAHDMENGPEDFPLERSDRGKLVSGRGNKGAALGSLR